jgi:6-phospho-beta-glucosidase
MPGFEHDDVVETDCDVDATGVQPRPHAPLPAEDMALLTRVKDYERLAVQAIREGSRALAVDALVAHPLVDDRVLAETLVRALGICGKPGR